MTDAKCQACRYMAFFPGRHQFANWRPRLAKSTIIASFTRYPLRALGISPPVFSRAWIGLWVSFSPPPAAFACPTPLFTNLPSTISCSVSPSSFHMGRIVNIALLVQISQNACHSALRCRPRHPQPYRQAQQLGWPRGWCHCRLLRCLHRSCRPRCSIHPQEVRCSPGAQGPVLSYLHKLNNKFEPTPLPFHARTCRPQ